MTKNRIVMTRSEAGIFVGELQSYKNREATLKKARRLWYWTGAATLSQLAQEGTSNPDACKFPCEVDLVVLPGIMEMLNVTTKAKKTFDAVPVWKA